jgi:hypothetical protein
MRFDQRLKRRRVLGGPSAGAGKFQTVALGPAVEQDFAAHIKAPLLSAIARARHT